MKEHRPLGWTTLEEAKLLVEAGIDPNTADMRYEENNYELLDEWVAYPFGGDIKDFEFLKKEFPDSEFYPCWSLGALIDLMPNEIRLNYLYTLNIFTTYGNKHCVSYHSICENIYAESESTLIESVVRCVFWLLHNNHIKKQE